jgi:hypothetical protein
LGLCAAIEEGEFGQFDQVLEYGPNSQHCPGTCVYLLSGSMSVRAL